MKLPGRVTRDDGVPSLEATTNVWTQPVLEIEQEPSPEKEDPRADGAAIADARRRRSVTRH